MENCLVIKIGGSIFDHPKILDDFIHFFYAILNPEWKYVINSRRRKQCNQLREQYKTTMYSEEKNSEFHWKSIKVMGDNARILHSKLITLSEEMSLLVD